MHFIIVLVGCCGCGKDLISKLLMLAYENLGFTMVSTSKILGGGNSDGSMVSNDLIVHLQLEKFLDKVGFFEFESEGGHYIFNGAGRNRTQMSSLIGMLCENGMLTSSAKFVRLNLTSAEALKRMTDRYHGNLQQGTLRKEEEGEYDSVIKRFRGRIGEWIKTRDGIFQSMEKNLRGYESSIFDVNACRSVSEVILDLVKQVGLPESPMIDVLQNNGFLEEKVNLVSKELDSVDTAIHIAVQ